MGMVHRIFNIKSYMIFNANMAYVRWYLRVFHGVCECCLCDKLLASKSHESEDSHFAFFRAYVFLYHLVRVSGINLFARDVLTNDNF